MRDRGLRQDIQLFTLPHLAQIVHEMTKLALKKRLLLVRQPRQLKDIHGAVGDDLAILFRDPQPLLERPARWPAALSPEIQDDVDDEMRLFRPTAHPLFAPGRHLAAIVRALIAHYPQGHIGINHALVLHAHKADNRLPMRGKPKLDHIALLFPQSVVNCITRARPGVPQVLRLNLAVNPVGREEDVDDVRKNVIEPFQILF